jgi:plastocyanin
MLGYSPAYAPGYSSVCGYGTSCGYATGYSSTYSGAYGSEQGYYGQPNGYVQGTTGSYGAQAAYATQTVTVTLTAHNNAFNLGTISVPAGAHVVVLFTNLDATPHNLAVYTDSSASQVIFRGQEITGPQATITYAFDAPAQPGTYFFRCDVHPMTMMGQFVVH